MTARVRAIYATLACIALILAGATVSVLTSGVFR